MTAGNRPRVYVSDLDGTLLGNDARLPERTRAILTRLLGEGLLFTVASARSVVAMQSILAGLTLDLPVVEFNGAFLSDLATGRHHVINDLGADIAAAAFATIREAGHVPFISSFDGRRDRLYYSEITNPGMKWYVDDRLASGDRRVECTDDLSARLRERIVCFTVTDRPGSLKGLCAELTRSLGERAFARRIPNQYFHGWDWLTVHDNRATKDRAVRTLLDRWCPPGAELVAFGDADNDAPLFRIAHRGVAVANASPELKALATEVIGRNDQGSVAAFLETEWRAESVAGRAMPAGEGR